MGVILSACFLFQLSLFVLPPTLFLPTRASEQGNVFGLVSVYIFVYKKICNLDKGSKLPQVVATDFFLKINSPSAGRNSGDSA